MRINVLTLFPEIINGGLSDSIVKRAVDNGLLSLNILNFRDFSENKHKKVDDSPYGGGAGMLIQVQPLKSTLESIETRGKVIHMSPRGKVFTQAIAEELSKEESLTFVCGHYEGIDQRFIDRYVDMEISIGDYILTGGELPALVVIDSISRLLDGVINKQESHEDESFTMHLLEYPHYTRPEEYQGDRVPDILLSGHHKNIELWRFEESVKLTYKNRPDLLEKFFKDKNIDEKLKKKAKEILK